MWGPVGPAVREETSEQLIQNRGLGFEMKKLKGNRIGMHLIKLEFSPHRKTKRFQPKRIVFKPKVKDIRIKNKLNFTFGLPDEEITKRFQSAVTDSVNKLKQLGLPVAIYDQELKKAYIQYPDGRREYV
ncbi:hypothetical protein [Macellibacteroides fermentans]|uniref:hypothetical protein n=1 Tax=Macellibacteroides fermentans TaxID=879969 RepID=UPI00406C58D8